MMRHGGATQRALSGRSSGQSRAQPCNLKRASASVPPGGPPVVGHSVGPTGFLLPVPGATSWKDCQPCPAGWLCSRAGLSSPDTPCEGGWFCPGSPVSGHSPGKLGKGVLWGDQGQPGGKKRPVGSPSR